MKRLEGIQRLRAASEVIHSLGNQCRRWKRKGGWEAIAAAHEAVRVALATLGWGRIEELDTLLREEVAPDLKEFMATTDPIFVHVQRDWTFKPLKKEKVKDV